MATLIQEDGSAYILCGRSLEQAIQVVDPDETTPIDLTGAVIKSQVRSKPGGYILFEFDVDVPDPTDGWVFLTAEWETTQNLRLTEAWWDVDMKLPGNKIDTIIEPTVVTIQRDVTRQ